MEVGKKVTVNVDQKEKPNRKTVASSTSGYNLRPRGGRVVESRLAMEMKTQQGGPIRARRSRGRNYSPPTSKSKQDQPTGMPDEEVINNGRTRKGKERVLANQYL
ncbi:hypothetical protein TNCV_4093351 [Trichonephila clavipes]|nr:hypothetical protein TNCV_4093351 [Trichonephila clavipes]